MIVSFRCRDTKALFNLKRSRVWGSIERPALRKLAQLDVAGTLDDLRVPPGNRLEPLSGNRKGQWSIRINDQFRLCFRWGPSGPEDVEIVDYH
ncbi:MAG: type II toxin-antitoxin system RelE/ParE family toxin [Nitratireductor sp.]